jgi:acyl-CoA synthetase (AMP-forming)/AMP-acid ligase II
VGSWSFAELAERAGAAAAWLDSLGCAPGEPVPALLDASPDAFALVLAGAATRRPLAPLNPRLTAPELSACLAAIGARLVVAEQAYATTLAVEQVAVVEPFGRADALDASRVSAADVALVLHTSGTTGAPRAVPWRQDRLAARVRAYASVLELGPGDVHMTAAPFHHSAGVGMSVVALALGARVLPMPRFNVDAWRAGLEQGATHAVVVPAMIETLLQQGALNANALKMLHYGGGPMRASTSRTLRGKVALLQTYGQTEGTPITCLLPSDHEDDDALATVGRAAPGVELEVRDGEVCARAEHMFAPDADGWLRTGDIGRLDADGFLTLTGRANERIVRGGENVYPAEVEAVIASHPSVADVAVVGAPDDRLGEEVVAYIVARGAPPPIEELRTFARARLAGFKVPARWTFVDAVPRNAAGKVLRSALHD